MDHPLSADLSCGDDLQLKLPVSTLALVEILSAAREAECDGRHADGTNVIRVLRIGSFVATRTTILEEA